MTVALFITCLNDTLLPRVGVAITRVLRHFGCRVQFPAAQTCCGQPAYNSGFASAARDVAARMLNVFEPFDAVVTPSASCAAMVRSHYADLFHGQPAQLRRAQQLGEKLHEFSGFLRDVLRIDLADHLSFEQPVTFHYPCHARTLFSATDLHSALQRCGAENVRSPAQIDLCCGFGGTFAADLPDVSTAMLQDKLAELSATRASTVICNEAGCALQITGGAHRAGLPLRVVHLAEVLAQRLGLMERA